MITQGGVVSIERQDFFFLEKQTKVTGHISQQGADPPSDVPDLTGCRSAVSGVRKKMKLHQRRSACKAHIEHGFTVALLQCNMFFEKIYIWFLLYLLYYDG